MVEDAGSVEDLDLEEVFAGPTADELRLEAEAFKAGWESEKAAMIHGAKSEAELIASDARLRAEEKISNAEAEAADKIEKAEAEALRIKDDAEESALAIKAQAEAGAVEQKALAEKEGFEKGRAEGYELGTAEVQRLIMRTQVIMERIQDKRDDIFSEAEQQLVDLVLLIARKVVKIISDTQRDVVIENIKEALNKAKSRGTVTIKVNLADLELATGRLQEFTKLLEGGGTIQLLEDSSIDRGGCVVETDFGELDARIANQLAKLESNILALSPVRRG
jgi:flagellar assembly protein FliH